MPRSKHAFLALNNETPAGPWGSRQQESCPSLSQKNFLFSWQTNVAHVVASTRH